MHHSTKNVEEKKSVALYSVFAAVFLTGSKTVIGILTGSLGILSEALHSGLDLVAAVITYFSVRVSDRPADKDHHYGHGKIENFSALIETLLLLVTCTWIIYEAIHRLKTGKVEIEVNHWSYIVVISSIIIDYNRSRKLMKVAKKHNSQALEADALHFSTDIWSSAVVLLGLICASFGIFSADAIAALIVACIVIYVSYQLGKKSIDVLLDKAPTDQVRIIEDIIKEVPQVSTFHDLKIRNSGADVLIELSIHVNPSLSIEEAHRISDEIENRIHTKIPRCIVHIHEEPEDRTQ
jgi:cation diffusion facilitator family transporter